VLERARKRIGDRIECRPTPEGGLERGECRERITGGRKQRAQARGIRAEQHGAVLQERRAEPPLRAADQLAAADLDLEGAGARETERRIGAEPAARRDHLRVRAQGIDPAHERTRDPAIRLEQIGADAEVVGGRRHAIRELTLRAVVVNRAAARRPAHEADAEAAARVDVHVAIERLAVADRHRRRIPGEEAHGGRRSAGVAAAPQRLVNRHVGGPVARLGDEKPPIHVGGPEMAPNPPTLGTPRETRGAPRARASAWGPEMAPKPPTLGTPRETRGAPRSRASAWGSTGGSARGWRAAGRGVGWAVSRGRG